MSARRDGEQGGPGTGTAGRGSGSWLLLLGVGAAALALARNGAGRYPLVDFLANDVASEWPNLPDDVPALFQFLLWSTLGPAVARVLAISSTNAYIALHTVLLIGGIATFAINVWRRYGRDAAVAALAVISLLPATTVVLAWSGSYDTLTLVLALHLTIVRSPRWALAIGCLLAFSAVEHGAIIIGILGLLALAKVAGELRVLLWGAVGLVAGGAALVVFLRAQGIDHGRAYWLEHYGVRYFLDFAGAHWPLLVLSTFGVLWPVVICLLLVGPPRRRAVILLALALPVAPMLITEDQTRVYAMLTAPVIVSVVLAQVERDPSPLRRPLALGLAFAWTPGFFIWKGSAHLATSGPWPWLTG